SSYSDIGLLKTGEGKAGKGHGESVSVDPFGSVTKSSTEQTFTAVRNQAKLETTTASSESTTVDGTKSKTDPYVTRYEYDKQGRLSKASLLGDIHTTSTDAFLSESESWARQTFVIVAGQAKVLETESWSRSESMDGSVTTTDPYKTQYSYFGQELGPLASRAQIGEWVNANGPLFGQVRGAELLGEIHSTTLDYFGNVSESLSTQRFERVLGQAKMVSTTVSSKTESADGSTTIVDPYTTKYEYDSATGLLIKAELVGVNLLVSPSGNAYPIVSRTSDPFGNESISWSAQKFEIVAGQAKMTSVTAESQSRGADGTGSTTDAYVTRYEYAGQNFFRNGRMVGNETAYRRLVEQGVVGQLAKAWIEAPLWPRVDTIENAGKTYRIGGPPYQIRTASVDLFGNKTYSYASQEFMVMAGQAKMTKTKTTSLSESVDGTVSFTEGYETVYRYAGQALFAGEKGPKTWSSEEAEAYGDLAEQGHVGHLAGVDNVLSRTVTEDALGNRTETESTQTFVIVGGQAKVKSAATKSKSVSVDGTESVTQPYTVTYSYRGENLGLGSKGDFARWVEKNGRRLGRYESVSPEVVVKTVSKDLYGTVTESTVTQYFEVMDSLDQAKMMKTRTTSETFSVDGSHTLTDPYLTEYTYDETTGKVKAVMLAGETHMGPSGDSSYFIHSKTTDAFGNMSENWTNQSFVVVADQAKMVSSAMESSSLSLDGTTSVTEAYATNYAYEGQELFEGGRGPKTWTEAEKTAYQVLVQKKIVGQLKDVSDPRVNTTTIDTFGNRTTSTTFQDFFVHKPTGQAKLWSTTTEKSVTTSIDGSISEVQPYVTHYKYEDLRDVRKGELIRVGGTRGADGTPMGPVTVETKTTDPFENVTFSKTVQTFVIIAGQTKVKSVVNSSRSLSIDGSETLTDPYTLSYTYNGENTNDYNNWITPDDQGRPTDKSSVGHLNGVTDGTGANNYLDVRSVTKDNFAETVSVSRQTYIVHPQTNQLRMFSAETLSSVTTSIDGSSTELQARYITYYKYDDLGLLAGVGGRLDRNGDVVIGSSVRVLNKSRDSFGNVTDSTADQVFGVVAGQAKMVSSTSGSHSVSVDGSVTDTDPYTTQYTFDGEGLSKEEIRERAIKDFKDGNEMAIGRLLTAAIVSDDVLMPGSPFPQTGAMPSGMGPYKIFSLTTDVYGNKIYSVSNQKFDVLFGQARLRSAENASRTESIDGSVTLSDPSLLVYSYYGEAGYPADGSKKHFKGTLANVWSLGRPLPGDVWNVLGSGAGPYQNHSKTTDVFGNVTHSFSNTKYRVLFNQAKMDEVESLSVSFSVDGTVSVTEPSVTMYEYDESNGLLQRATLVEGARIPDRSGDRLAGLGIDEGALAALLGMEEVRLGGAGPDGKVLLRARDKDGRELEGALLITQEEGKSSGTRSNVLSLSLSAQGVAKDVLLTYAFDPAGGLLSISGQETSRLKEDGGERTFTARRSYSLSRGRLRLDEETAGFKETSAAGETTTVDPYETQYEYGADGLLKSLHLEKNYRGPSGTNYGIHTVTVDAFGNVTESWTNQVFQVIAGQAKVVSTVSESRTSGTDGTESRTHPYETVNHYSEVGLLDGVQVRKLTGYSYPAIAVTVEGIAYRPEGTVFTESKDAFGNMSYSWVDQKYDVLFGQAKMREVKTQSATVSFDGSVGYTAPYTMTYGYYGEAGMPEDKTAKHFKGLLAEAKLVSVPGQQAPIYTVNEDTFGNVTKSWSAQEYGVIGGQAKMTKVTTESVSQSVDGTKSTTAPYVMEYHYLENGLLDQSRPPEVSRQGGPVEVIIAGERRSIDGDIHTETVDAFGNVSHTMVKQTYQVLAGQAKLEKVTTESISESLDGTKSFTAPYAMAYSYYADTAENRTLRRVGQLDVETPPVVKKAGEHPAVSVTIESRTFRPEGEIYTESEDSFGNLSYSWADQTYVVLIGQAKLKETRTSSIAKSIDGTESHTAPYTMTYDYYDAGPKLGQLKEVKQVTVQTQSQDAFGSLTATTSVQEYTVIAGQAKMAKVTTKSTSTSIDGTVSETKPYV
ncbi:MAG: hypothetical protein HY548_04745, partial [Elusimicrobia bacterium]|nr:hypothetical protein [Elusimicrobiota bacterium]